MGVTGVYTSGVSGRIKGDNTKCLGKHLIPKSYHHSLEGRRLRVIGKELGISLGGWWKWPKMDYSDDRVTLCWKTIELYTFNEWVAWHVKYISPKLWKRKYKGSGVNLSSNSLGKRQGKEGMACLWTSLGQHALANSWSGSEYAAVPKTLQTSHQTLFTERNLASSAANHGSHGRFQ